MSTQSIVELTKKAQKDIVTIPDYIKRKLLMWIDSVEAHGIYKIRKIPGFHDEPLKGNRLGQRSIRLSKSYRAIYSMGTKGVMEIISIEEVNKHEY